ncbi:MAG: hypothetical protein Q8P20_01405 [bacterium]|nr:hypothetical protein [bacterium]
MEFSEKKPGNSLESRENEPKLCEVNDLFSYLGISREQAIEMCLQSLEKIMQDGGREAERYEKQLELDSQRTDQEHLREKITAAMDEYQEKFSHRIDRLQQIGNHCVRFAQDKGYIDNSRQIVAVIAGSKFEKLIPEMSNKSYSPGRYFMKSDIAVIGNDQRESLFRHELGHALSARHEQNEVGLLKFDVIPEDDEMNNTFSSWLDEGATEIWEDESRIGDEQEPLNDMRGNAMRIVMEKINLDNEYILRAYFGDKEAYRAIDQNTRQKYNIPFEDLNCLKVNFNPKFLNEVLDGKPVELKFREGIDSPTMLPGMKLLAEKFPNVTVLIIDKKN